MCLLLQLKDVRLYHLEVSRRMNCLVSIAEIPPAPHFWHQGPKAQGKLRKRRNEPNKDVHHSIMHVMLDHQSGLYDIGPLLHIQVERAFKRQIIAVIHPAMSTKILAGATSDM